MDLTILINAYQKNCFKLLETINSQIDIKKFNPQVIIFNSNSRYEYNNFNLINCDRQYVNSLIQNNNVLYLTPNLILSDPNTLSKLNELSQCTIIDCNGAVYTNIKNIDIIEKDIIFNSNYIDFNTVFSTSNLPENYNNYYLYIWKSENIYKLKTDIEKEYFLSTMCHLVENKIDLSVENHFLYKYVNRAFLAHFAINVLGREYQYNNNLLKIYVAQLICDYDNCLVQTFKLLSDDNFYNLSGLCYKNIVNQLKAKHKEIKNYAYVLYLSNDTYLYGTITTYISLLLNNCKYPIYCCITNNLLPETIQTLKEFNLFTIEVDKITPNDISLKYYRADDGSLFENNHWYRAFGKISIFNLETFNKIVYLDSDMQVVQNIDELFDKPHMSAVRAGEDLDWLNSGIMVIEPNSTEFNKLLEIVYNNEDATIYNDEGIIKTYDPDWNSKVELHLSPIYNLNTLNQEEIKQNYNISTNELKVYHQIGKKPWEYNYELFNNYIDSLNWKYRDFSLTLIHYYSLYDEIKNINHQNKLLTIIIPTHNESIEQIAPLFYSISNQKNVNWEQIEIIVGNNNDNYLKILPFIMSLPIFKYIKLVPNNFNTIGGHEEYMIQISSGKYFWILNADDEIQNENAVQVILDNIYKNPNLNMYDYSYELVTETGTSVVGYELNCSAIWTKILQKQYILDNDIHFHPWLITCEDCYYLETLTSNNNLKWIFYDFPIYKHIVFSTSTGGQYNSSIKTKLECYLDIIRKLEYEITYVINHNNETKIEDLIYFQFSYLYWYITQFNEFPKYKKLLENIVGNFLANYSKYTNRCLEEIVYNYFNNNETSIEWLKRILKV